MLFGGDFRQTLPIIKHGSTDAIMYVCVIPTIYPHYKHESKLGSNLPTHHIPPFHSCIEIHNSCICAGEFDTTIFPDGLSSTEFQQRVILTPTNRSSLAINDNILKRMPG